MTIMSPSAASETASEIVLYAPFLPSLLTTRSLLPLTAVMDLKGVRKSASAALAFILKIKRDPKNTESVIRVSTVFIRIFRLFIPDILMDKAASDKGYL